MPKLVRKRKKQPGLPPGTLLYEGEKKVEIARITLIDYDETHLQEKQVNRIEDCFPFKDEPTVTWINIDGLHDIEMVEKLGKRFDIHPLVLEDIVSGGQRPKMDDFDDYIFVITTVRLKVE